MNNEQCLSASDKEQVWETAITTFPHLVDSSCFEEHVIDVKKAFTALFLGSDPEQSDK